MHQKDDYLVLHVGGYKGRRKLRDSMEMFKAVLTDKFAVRLGTWWRDEGCQMDLAPPLAGLGRILLVGDAAGFMYLSGGIQSAMDSGNRCGKAIAQALRDGTDAAASYAESTKGIAAHVQHCIANVHFFATPLPAM